MNAALSELEALAMKLGITVVYDHFTGEGMGPGGICRVKGSWRVIIERRASQSEKISVLVRALGRFDTEALEVSADLREMIERSRRVPGTVVSS